MVDFAHSLSRFVERKMRSMLFPGSVHAPQSLPELITSDPRRLVVLPVTQSEFFELNEMTSFIRPFGFQFGQPGMYTYIEALRRR